MAEAAVSRYGPSLCVLVLATMAAEATWEISMPEVVRIGLPVQVHAREVGLAVEPVLYA